MAQLPIQSLTGGVGVITWHNASASDTYFNDPVGPSVDLLVRNTSGATRTVTVAATITTTPANNAFPALTVANVVVAVPAGGQAVLQNLPACYKSTSDSKTVTVTVDNVSGVQYAPVARGY